MGSQCPEVSFDNFFWKKSKKIIEYPTTARITSSQDDLDDDSVQGKMSLDNFSIFSSE